MAQCRPKRRIGVFDLGHFGTRGATSHRHGRHRECHLIGARGVVFPVMSSAGVVHERENSPRVLSDGNGQTFPRGGVEVAFENGSVLNSVQVRVVASKTDQTRAGSTITGTRLAEAGEPRRGPGGAFQALLDLLAVHPLLPGRSLSTVRLTSLGWKSVTGKEAVAALRLMTGSSGKGP